MRECKLKQHSLKHGMEYNKMDKIILHLTGYCLPHRLGWCSYRKEFAPSIRANSFMQEHHPKSVDLSGFH